MSSRNFKYSNRQKKLDEKMLSKKTMYGRTWKKKKLKYDLKHLDLFVYISSSNVWFRNVYIVAKLFAIVTIQQQQQQKMMNNNSNYEAGTATLDLNGLGKKVVYSKYMTRKDHY